MTKKFISLLTATAVIGGAATLFAEAKAGEGTLMVDGKNYPLTHVLAYSAKVYGEEGIAVVLSGQAVSNATLKEVMAGEKNDQGPEFKRPYLKLQFNKAGELALWRAAAGNTSLVGGRDQGKGELKMQDGRVNGTANKPNVAGNVRSGFDVRFDVALFGAAETAPPTSTKKPGPAANVKPTVTGVFKGNGKEAKLAYVSAHWREPFNDEPGIALVFTEKDHSKDKKPDFNAAFSRFGSALIISLHEDGGIFGCQVVHDAHAKKGFSSIGEIKTNNFKYAGGQVEGELATDGTVDTFGEKWEVNLKFVAPLGEIPKEFQTADSKEDKPATTKPTATSTTATPVEKPGTPPAEDQFKIKDLVLTKDATDLDYKLPLKQLLFKTKSDVKGASAELAANLTAQGWTNDGTETVNEQSAILRRKRGNSRLTVLVRPEKDGSLVTIFAKGFSWEGQ